MMAPRDGFEPPARRLTVVCSTAELPGNNKLTLKYFLNVNILKCNHLILEIVSSDYFWLTINLAILFISKSDSVFASICLIVLRSFFIVFEEYEGS